MKTIARNLSAGLTLGMTLWTAPASAQSTSTLSPGDSVLVTWTIPGSSPYSLYSFGDHIARASIEVVRIEGGRLTGVRFRGPGRVSRLVIVDTSQIRSLKKRIGTRPSVAPAMVYGSAAGFAAGFLGGAWDASASNGGAGSSGAVDAGLRAGVLIGAPLGAMIAFLASRSRGIYEDIDVAGLRPTVAVAPVGGGRVSLAVTAVRRR